MQEKYGKLTLVGFHHRDSKNAYQVWKCDCGGVAVATRSKVKSGHTSSCGCVHRKRSSDVMASNKTTHGQSGHPLYARWKAMKARCTNPNVKQYKDWGGRGITVCHRWLSFENYLADVEPMYLAAKKLHGDIPLQGDRIDNNGNYESGNYRFVTAQVNSQNRRKHGAECS